MNEINETTIKKIEQAMGFKLYPWQRYYLYFGFELSEYYRGAGNTTIYAIKKLLTLEEELDLNKDEDLFKLVDYCPSMRALNAFRSMIEDINDKLKSVGLRTCVRDTNKMLTVEITTNRETGATEVKCNGKKTDTEELERIKIENGPMIIMKPPKYGWASIDV